MIRFEFIQGLRVMADEGYYELLGSPSIEAYAQDHFRYQRTQTLEMVRVARVLPDLALLRESFLSGEISWSVLQEITRVATPASQEEWITFAKEHTFKRLKDEVRDAEEKGRDRPRRGKGGSPNLRVRLHFELSAEERDLLHKALLMIAMEMSR